MLQEISKSAEEPDRLREENRRDDRNVLLYTVDCDNNVARVIEVKVLALIANMVRRIEPWYSTCMIREVISYYDKTQKHWNVEKYVCIKMKCCNF